MDLPARCAQETMPDIVAVHRVPHDLAAIVDAGGHRSERTRNGECCDCSIGAAYEALQNGVGIEEVSDNGPGGVNREHIGAIRRPWRIERCDDATRVARKTVRQP